MRITTVSRGFTLVELLVSIGVIGLLMGLLAPVVQYARLQARSAGCQNNLRQLFLDIASNEVAFGHIVHYSSLCDPLVCPEAMARHESTFHATALDWYKQDAEGRRDQIIENRNGLPSSKIVLISDSSAIHAGEAFAVFLGGNVGVFPPGYGVRGVYPDN